MHGLLFYITKLNNFLENLMKDDTFKIYALEK